MVEEYYNSERIEELQKRFTDAFNQKSSYETLWQKIITLNF